MGEMPCVKGALYYFILFCLWEVVECYVPCGQDGLWDTRKFMVVMNIGFKEFQGMELLILVSLFLGSFLKLKDL
jgi:hypothetical protein